VRVGLLADIHANDFALQAAINDANSSNAIGNDPVREWWILGDIFGRCSQSVNVLESLRQLNIGAWVQGNHDYAVTEGRSLANDDDVAIRRHRGELEKARLNGFHSGGEPAPDAPLALNWFRQRAGHYQEKTFGDIHFRLTHGKMGSLKDHIGMGSESYIFHWKIETLQNQAELLESYYPEGKAALVFGHTHMAFFAGRNRGERKWTLLPIWYVQEYKLNDYDYYLVNPGSVSLPRNHNGRPAAFDYAWINADDTQHEVSIRFRRFYNKDVLQKSLKDMQDNQYPEGLVRQVGGMESELWNDWEKCYRKLPPDRKTAQPQGWEPIIQAIEW
jgi:predicted phosphodiesterase